MGDLFPAFQGNRRVSVCCVFVVICFGLVWGFFALCLFQVILIQDNQYAKVAYFGVACHIPHGISLMIYEVSLGSSEMNFLIYIVTYFLCILKNTTYTQKYIKKLACQMCAFPDIFDQYDSMKVFFKINELNF